MHCSVTLGRRIVALASVAIQTEIRKKNEHKEKKNLMPMAELKQR